jgi:hypothetical protein
MRNRQKTRPTINRIRSIIRKTRISPSNGKVNYNEYWFQIASKLPTDDLILILSHDSPQGHMFGQPELIEACQTLMVERIVGLGC